MYKWIAISLVALSFNANADVVNIPCDFAKEKGMKFRFTDIGEKTKFNTRNEGAVYPKWVDDRFDPKKLKEKDYSYRQGKLETGQFYRRLENVEGYKEKVFNRYYKATTENCKVVWAVVNESDIKLKEYFDTEDHQQNGDLPWNEVSNFFHMQLSDDFLKLHAWQGKKITLLPFNEKTNVFGKSKDQQKITKLEYFNELKLINVHPGSYNENGKLISTIQIEVQDINDNLYLMPWSPKRMMMGSPWNNKNIRKQYINDIKKNQIRFGMNYHEVKLAFGRPDKERWLPIYPKQGSESKFIKDDMYPYADRFNVHTVTVQKEMYKKGHFLELYYENWLKENETLVFDENGILDRINQTMHLNKANIHHDVALKEFR
jgi:hypothetical protein